METGTEDDESLQTQWHYNGRQRPDFAELAGPEQESVWDYPRPPELAPDPRLVEVFADGVRIAKSERTVRVLETASPPAFYIPPDDVRRQLLIPEHGESACEWKGIASYWSLVMGNVTVRNVAWSYARPVGAYAEIAGFLSFYPARLECRVGGERVTSQPGGCYGGWVTSGIVGPFKGAQGTEWW